MHIVGGKGGSGTGKDRTPYANFKTLVIKNVIKPKIGEPPGNFLWKP
jgi:hypothetical protein